MPHQPRVSICIPSYNHARYLPAAIESALGQTYGDFEIVIVDDGSTDGSLQIAEGYAARHPSQVRVFTHPGRRNLGVSETVNLAYRESRGEYWSGLPSDDLLYPDKLERQVAFLDAHPKIGWVYSYADFVDAEGRARPELGLFGKDITRDPNPLQSLIERNYIPGMTVLMRRSCTEKVGLHEAGLIYSDWEFWLRMLARCEAAFLARPLVRYRLHAYNASVNVEARENMRRGLEVMISLRGKAEGIGHKLADARTRALLDLQLAYHLFSLEREAEAERSLCAAFDTDQTLARDSKFFLRWLRARVLELHHTFAHGPAGSSFALWVHRRLPPAAGKSLARGAAATHLAQVAFKSRETNFRAGRRMALNCLSKDPSLLWDRSLRFILLESILGTKVAGGLRRLKSFIHGYA